MEFRWDHIISLTTSWVSTLLNQYTNWLRSINFSRCCTFVLGPLCSCQYLWYSLYMILMVVTFFWSWSLIVNKIWSSFTMLLVICLSKVFSSLLKWPTCACPTNVSLTLWLWTPQLTKVSNQTIWQTFPLI